MKDFGGVAAVLLVVWAPGLVGGDVPAECESGDGHGKSWKVGLGFDVMTDTMAEEWSNWRRNKLQHAFNYGKSHRKVRCTAPD